MIQHNVDIFYQILAAVFSILSGWFVRTKSKRHYLGVWFGFLSEPFYIGSFLINRQWPFLLVALVFTFIWGDALIFYERRNA